MYNLPYFKEGDKEVVLQFVRDYPFALLTGCDAENKPVTTQVLFFIDERDGKLFLSGHMMKNTDHHKAFVHNNNVLAVFTGPHTYVSATWYDDPRQASTWNYMSVHIKGRMRFGDTDELVAILKRLTLYYEDNNTASSTVFDNLPAAYTEQLMKAIVSFEIEVVSIENVFKLSQNKNEKSYDNIITKLKKKGGDAEQIGTIMEQRRSKLFPV
ncbi:MAG TPA: FMN-binding negative transcriptional regulator [Chitinophagaceae bacterium]|jgi:transcriptional regulator|nr:FMN-binding negative transcriptional regulator [Chitinophagaceae bacterium]